MNDDIRPLILVIDDDLGIREALAGTLKNDYRVQPLAYGEDTLERAVALRPALILLDILLPGISGFEVCRQLRERAETRTTPVLFMTAMNPEESFKESVSAGGDAWISKPFTPEQLLGRIRELLTAPPERKGDGV
ncbi:MAG: response regulator [Elusimicrobiota bacterium]|jgi:DNA-binding response OmpR family regulator